MIIFTFLYFHIGNFKMKKRQGSPTFDVEDRISLMDHAKVPKGVSHSGCNTNGSAVSRESNTNIRKLIIEAISPLLILYPPYLSSRQTLHILNGSITIFFVTILSNSFVNLTYLYVTIPFIYFSIHRII